MLLPLEEIDKINDYPKGKWADLLALISIIERLNNRDKSLDTITDPIALSKHIYDEIDSKLHKVIFANDLMVVFDWVNWKKGLNLINKPNGDFRNLNLIELCKILTMILRKERFSEGTVISLLDNGTILKVLKEIEKNLNQENKK